LQSTNKLDCQLEIESDVIMIFSACSLGDKEIESKRREREREREREKEKSRAYEMGFF
jgi:queuine/archaeosine tRNA-ribosyltransferase